MPAIAPTWTAARIELLKRGFEAGFSCREIAAEIGVSRNAVIGKLSRLNLTRQENPPQRRAQKRAAKTNALSTTPRGQHEMRTAAYAEAPPAIPDGQPDDARRCSLFELSEERCRWPISTPGAEDFCFCGNMPLEGVPYCEGHSRLAYRSGTRPRLARA